MPLPSLTVKQAVRSLPPFSSSPADRPISRRRPRNASLSVNVPRAAGRNATRMSADYRSLPAARVPPA
jgi:hypothetical protein